MALVHRADLRPSKLDLLAAWLPDRSWYQGEADTALTRVGAYRFDDPAGEVGIETLLVRSGGGPVHQVPLTYRGAPLPGADRWLVGNIDHSVLGKRWVYDGCADPVYVTALARAILAGAAQADEFIETDGRLERREPTMTIISNAPSSDVEVEIGTVDHVTGDDPTLITTPTVVLAVLRRLDSVPVSASARLSGTWQGQPTPSPLAYVH
jgi:hypothetical protein